MGLRGIEPRPAGLQPAAPPATLQPPCRRVGRPGGTRTPAPRFVRPPRCRCATGRWSTREDLNLRPPRYQRGAHTEPGSWSFVGQVGLEPTIPCSQSRWDGRFPTTRCVPAPGLEPGRPEGHGVLSAARLPDSARRAYCISERMTGLEPAVSCMASRCASTCASSAYTGSPPCRLVERRGIEPRRACLQGKPGHLSPPLTYPPRESNSHATGAPLLEGGASAGSATRASVPPAGLEPASSRLRTGRP